MAKDKVFSKTQENQILKALNAMDKDLGIDKLDDLKKRLKKNF
jgi:Mg/Co/Ni transporter MgtE